jgi:hypothetical protein
MFEITINDKVYSFNFGIGFVREINKRNTQTVNGIKKDVGLQFAIASVIDRDLLDVLDILLVANRTAGGEKLTMKELEAYIDDESTDIDALCDEILDFFEHTNAVKPTLAKVKELIAAQQEKNEQK